MMCYITKALLLEPIFHYADNIVISEPAVASIINHNVSQEQPEITYVENFKLEKKLDIPMEEFMVTLANAPPEDFYDNQFQAGVVPSELLEKRLENLTRLAVVAVNWFVERFSYKKPYEEVVPLVSFNFLLEHVENSKKQKLASIDSASTIASD